MNCIEAELFVSIDKLLPCYNNMVSSGHRENVILAKLYLAHMAPMDVQREPHGAKGEGGGFWFPLV